MKLLKLSLCLFSTLALANASLQAKKDICHKEAAYYVRLTYLNIINPIKIYMANQEKWQQSYDMVKKNGCNSVIESSAGILFNLMQVRDVYFGIE